MKSPKLGNKAHRKVEKLLQKLSAEVITENYELVYHDAKNVRFIGILAYPKSVDELAVYEMYCNLNVYQCIEIYIFQ